MQQYETLNGLVLRWIKSQNRARASHVQESTRYSSAARRVSPHLQAWAVPVLYLVLAGVASAQSASDFGTVQTGAKAVVNLIRIIGGVVGVAALVFGSFRLMGGDMVRGLMGVFGSVLALLIAANAQSIVTGFYSTTG